MSFLDRVWRGGRIVEMGTVGLARYATLSSGETIWWGSEEEVPDRVARAAFAASAEAGRTPTAGARAAA
jgi:hypothetical protein